MESFWSVVWLIIRGIILLALIAMVVGLGICGVVLGSFSSNDPGGLLVLIALIGGGMLLLIWITWLVFRALFPAQRKERPVPVSPSSVSAGDDPNP